MSGQKGFSSSQLQGTVHHSKKIPAQNWSHCTQTWETERVDALLPVVSAFSPCFLQSAQGRVLPTVTVIFPVSPTGIQGMHMPDDYRFCLLPLKLSITLLKKMNIRYFFSVQKDTYVNSCPNYVTCLWMFGTQMEITKNDICFPLTFKDLEVHS